MAKSQKEAVVEEVKLAIPGFVPYKDNAIIHLTERDLEDIKANIMNGIINGTIEYGKDVNNHSEVRTYARSMVMNHLKKAKELNGGAILERTVVEGSAPRTVRSRVKIAPRGVVVDIMPQELQDFARTLV